MYVKWLYYIECFLYKNGFFFFFKRIVFFYYNIECDIMFLKFCLIIKYINIMSNKVIIFLVINILVFVFNLVVCKLAVFR